MIIKYDEKTDIYTFNAFFGVDFSWEIGRQISRSRIKYIFISITMFDIKIYGFFLFEMYNILKDMLEEANIDKYFRVNKSILVETIREIELIFNSIKTNKEVIDYDIIGELFKFEIRNYQKIAYEDYVRIKANKYYRGYLLDAGTGTGKTFMGMSLAEALHADTIIVVASNVICQNVWIPALCGNYDNTVSKEEIYKKRQEVYCTLGVKHYLVKNTYAEQKHILCSYETIDTVTDNILKYVNGNKIAIVVDEYHNFSDLYSARTQSLVRLIEASKSNDIIPMSGTPFKATPSELTTLFKILDRRYNRFIQERFEKIYSNPGNLLKSYLPIRYTEYAVKISKDVLNQKQPINIDIKVTIPDGEQYTLEAMYLKLDTYIKERVKYYELHFDEYSEEYKTLYSIAKGKALVTKIAKPSDFHNYEKDILSIRKYYKERKLIMYPDLLQRVNKFEREIIVKCLDTKEERDRFKIVKTVVKYVMLKIRGEALANVFLRSRIDCYSKIASAINYQGIINSSEKKVIVFSKFIEVCDAAVNSISKSNKVILAYGNYAGKNLTEKISTFKTNKSYNIIVTTYNSLGTGVPLTEANTVVAIDTPYRAYGYDQAIARVSRSGQDKQTYIYLPTLDTGDKPNIVDRGFDIIEYFMKSVEEITGHKLFVNVEKNKQIENDSDIIALEDDNNQKYIHDRRMYIRSMDIGHSDNPYVSDLWAAMESYDELHKIKNNMIERIFGWR